VHGHQEGPFFHGYYDCYCYLPPYVFCGLYLRREAAPRQHRRRGGSVKEIERSARRTRACRPRVRLLRGDSGFAREALIAWGEANRVDYLFGLARNARLVGEIETRMAHACIENEVRAG
jgi:hypothetical protein